MKNTTGIIILFVFLAGCKKEATENTLTEANYRIELKGLWKSPEFSVPAGVHFTLFGGMVHTKNAYLWQEGSLASRGVENVAETDNTTRLITEMDSIVAQKNASSLFLITAPSATGVSSGNIYTNSNYSHISFVSMIAPSPDWFIGLNSFNLLQNGKWMTDTTINLYVFDAGTEDGDVFGYANPATVPQQPIVPLTSSNAMVLANGNITLAPIAAVRLIKQ